MSVLVNVAPRFIKHLRKLPRRIQVLVVKKDNFFRENPFSTQLNTHKLKGALDGFWSYAVNHEDRVLFRFINDHEVLYYDIGTHEIYQ